MSKDKYKITKSTEQPKKKRIRRTREQLIAAGYYNQNDGKKSKKYPQNDGEPKVKIKETKVQSKDIDRSHMFISGSLSADKISEKAILKAKEQGKENWEQDFRNDYEKGQKIYYVEINDLCHTKELLELYIGTVYSKVIIAWVDRGESHTIGMDDADKIFRDEKEARKYYQKVRIK